MSDREPRGFFVAYKYESILSTGVRTPEWGKISNAFTGAPIFLADSLFLREYSYESSMVPGMVYLNFVRAEK